MLWPVCGTSSSATGGLNWPAPPPNRWVGSHTPRRMPAAQTRGPSSWPSGLRRSATRTSIASFSPPAAPRRTNRRSKRPATIGSWRASPTKPRSSAAPGAITARRWPRCRPRACRTIGRCSSRACRAFCTSKAPIRIASARRGACGPTIRARSGQIAADLLEEAIVREGADTVAAFIGEPVQGAGGAIVPPEDYWPRIRQICDRHDVLLIADEVITGFGRTGDWFALVTLWHRARHDHLRQRNHERLFPAGRSGHQRPDCRGPRFRLRR